MKCRSRKTKFDCCTYNIDLVPNSRNIIQTVLAFQQDTDAEVHNKNPRDPSTSTSTQLFLLSSARPYWWVPAHHHRSPRIVSLGWNICQHVVWTSVHEKCFCRKCQLFNQDSGDRLTRLLQQLHDFQRCMTGHLEYCLPRNLSSIDAHQRVHMGRSWRPHPSQGQMCREI